MFPEFNSCDSNLLKLLENIWFSDWLMFLLSTAEESVSSDKNPVARKNKPATANKIEEENIRAEFFIIKTHSAQIIKL